MQGDGVLTVGQAARALGVSKRTVSRWLAQGHLPGAYKAGFGLTSPWRIPSSTVATVLQGRGQDADAMLDRATLARRG